MLPVEPLKSILRDHASLEAVKVLRVQSIKSLTVPIISHPVETSTQEPIEAFADQREREIIVPTWETKNVTKVFHVPKYLFMDVEIRYPKLRGDFGDM
jgi:hypothetical protein